MSLWEVNFILMQIFFIVLLLQHGRCEHTLYFPISGNTSSRQILKALFSLPLSLVGLCTQKTKNDGPSLEYLQHKNCDFLINLVYAVFIFQFDRNLTSEVLRGGGVGGAWSGHPNPPPRSATGIQSSHRSV